VLLDALGTLVELEPPWPRLGSILRERHGLDVSDEDAKRAFVAEMSYYRSHHLEGGDEESLAKLRERCALVLREQLPELRELSPSEVLEALLESLRFAPYPDAAPALVALRAADVRLAVVSNWDCSLRSVLAELGLGAALDAVVLSAEVGAPKPSERIFRAALERLGTAPARSLFVGDSLETDVAGAREAGMHAVLVNRSGVEVDEHVERISTLTELPALVAV
jgi:putative hydrolase of the HAD superfamily